MIRNLVYTMRDAATRGAWSEMEKYFPLDTGGVRGQAHRAVSGSIEAGGLSFWLRSAEVALDEMRVDVVAPDIVAVAVPFTVEGGTATWGAVFTHKPQGWVVHCTTEQYPRADLRPGCIASSSS
ncbi:MAG: hypothetical protein ACREMV_06365 [Gemmatimonadales bacterium]